MNDIFIPFCDVLVLSIISDSLWSPATKIDAQDFKLKIKIFIPFCDALIVLAIVDNDLCSADLCIN